MQGKTCTLYLNTEIMEQFSTREKEMTLTGVNSYTVSNFEERITAISKELVRLKSCKNKAERTEILNEINDLYRGRLL